MDYNTGNLSQVIPSTGAVNYTLSVGGNAAGMCYDPSTDSLWITRLSSNTLTKVNATSGSVIGTYNIGAFPLFPCFDPITCSIWVPCENSNEVQQFRAIDGSLLNALSVSGAYWTTFDPSTNSVWSLNSNATITQINVSTSSIVSTYTPGFASGFGINGFCYDPATVSLWAIDYANELLCQFRISDKKLIRSIPLANGTNAYITFDPSTNSLFAAGSNSNLTKINLK